MKKIISLIALTLAFWGCQKTSPEIKEKPDPAPLIELDAADVTILADGGTAEIGYLLTNPIENATITFETSANWITQIKANPEGKITFNVEKNELTEPREAIVTVVYPKLETKPSFIIKQEPAVKKDFAITLSDATTNSFKLNIVPADLNMNYFYHVIPSSTAAQYPDDDALYQYDIAFYEDMDSSVGLGWQAWAIDDLKKGAITDLVINSMDPDTEYLVYAYGVNETFQRTTPIERQTIKTLKPEILKVNFKIEIVSDASAETKAKVTSEGYDGYFVAKIYNKAKESDTEEDVKNQISEYWKDEVQMAGWIGYTTEQILSMHASMNNAEPTKAVDPGQVCYAYAFAVDSNALRCSDISVVRFVAK